MISSRVMLFNLFQTTQQKLIRLSQAIQILTVNLATQLYTSLGGVLKDKTDENDDEEVES